MNFYAMRRKIFHDLYMSNNNLKYILILSLEKIMYFYKQNGKKNSEKKFLKSFSEFLRNILNFQN